MNESALNEVYRGYGVRFRYPPHWELSEEKAEQQNSATVSSTETSFWSLTLFFDRPRSEDLIESAVEVFRNEYEECDIYPTESVVCHRTSVARDLEFVCLELVNSAFLRAFETSQFTALVLYQGTDTELQESKEMLEEITASLECDGDETIFS